MDEIDQENDVKIMKYSSGSTGKEECCRSRELVLVSGLQEGTSSSRSNDYKLKNEGKVLFRKKSLLPIFAPNHPYRSACYTVSSNCKSNVSMFTQRIMSAKLLGLRNLQNKLSETQIRLQELVEENRVLNSLLKRQERALKKYEGEEAQLPQLIKTHSDEMRVLQTKYKQLKATCHDLEQKLKARDNELNCLREQHKHLLHLSKDKHLGDREKLRHQVEELHETVNAQEEKIKTLIRKVELESKNHKHQLKTEIGKHRETQRQLSQALSSLQKLEAALEVKQKYTGGVSGRPHHFLSNSTIGPLPAISKQVLSSSQLSRLKERLSEKLDDEDESQGKNGSDSKPTTVTSSAPNSEYEGNGLLGTRLKNGKELNSSSDSTTSKGKESSSSLKSKSKSSGSSYDYNFESSDYTIAKNSEQETVDNDVPLPNIFVNESPDILKNSLRSEKVSSESSKKPLTRQNSVRDEVSADLKPCKVDSNPSFNLKEVGHKNYGNKEEILWEEIKKQVHAEHEVAKKKLESLAKTDFETDLLDFSISNEFDNSKKNALLKALNDIDREKNCKMELNSDSDSSQYKNSKFGEDFMDFYRAQSGDSKYSPTGDHLLSTDCSDLKEKRNGLVRDWFFNQYDYEVAKSALNEKEKIQAVSNSNCNGSDSSS